ncbi:MAG: Crp/Fnr family transcriptional regulator [Cyclobacteriaceae bacterium]|nr:Crp/Fnr family transcriptional regulator [Cyclobacteriaceae bacterium]MCH8514950.1 Crp/Fnr family transcriptional regulator [Cyclobacteriaceae bacterium]
MSVKHKVTPCELCASRKKSLFSDVSSEHMCSISDHKSMISHKKGQILFYEGTRPLGLFCISHGVVKVYKTASNGKEQIIKLAKAGDFLGYSSLLSEEAYLNTASIVEDASICFIPKENFFKLLHTDSDFSRRLTAAICKDLGVAEERITDTAQKSIRERLAQTLLMLSETYGIDGEESRKIDVALTREEIAGIVGTATETVIRLLSEFKKDKLIDLQGKKIIILDKHRLSKTADFYA